MADAFAGDDASPPLVLVYGDSGLGKTTDDLYSFPNGVFFGVEDAVRPAATTCGYLLRKDQIVEVHNLSQLLNVLMTMRDHQKSTGKQLYREFIIDDLSELAKNQVQSMKASGNYTVRGGFNFTLWTDLTDLITDIGFIMRFEMGGTAVFNAHKREPETDKEGVYWKGGPMFPSRKLTRAIPHIATSVYQVGIDDSMYGEHKGVYRQSAPDPSWHMKCRLNWKGVLPMNLAEILRNASPINWRVPRHPELTWMDSWVAGGAKAYLEHKDWAKVSKNIVEKILARRSGTPDAHLVWVLRDASARAILLRARQESRLSMWGA